MSKIKPYPSIDLSGDGRVVLYTDVLPVGGRLAGFGSPSETVFRKAEFILATGVAAHAWPKRCRVLKSQGEFGNPGHLDDFASACPSSTIETTTNAYGQPRYSWITIANDTDLVIFKMTMLDTLIG